MKKHGTKELAYFRWIAELAGAGVQRQQYLAMPATGNYVGLHQPGKTEVTRVVRDPWRRHLVWALLALALTSILLAIAALLYSYIDESEGAARLRYRTDEEPGGRAKREAGEAESTERVRRAAVEAATQEAEERLMSLMREPGCREDCARLERRLRGLARSADTLLADLLAFRREVDQLARGCGNRTEEEDSRELELSLPHLHPANGDELEELTGRAANDKVVDHDLAGSAVDEVRYPGLPPAYPWPPALQGNERHDGIPPTGPDSSGLVVGAEPTGSGPGEAVHTSQQMSVSLPQRLERVCSMVPGPPGSAGYICSPVRDLMTDSQPPRDNFYLQVVGRSSQTHVPTAISTPNPYAFPTLSGSPVIVPASAAAPDQLIPVYNPTDGRILLQNYHQSTPVLQQPQDHLAVVPSQQGTSNPPSPQQQGYSSANPFQQFILAQYVPQGGFTPAQPVYSPAQQALRPPQLVYSYSPANQASSPVLPVLTQPTYAQLQPSYSPAAPAQASFFPGQQIFSSPQPVAPVQPQLNSYSSQVAYQQPAFPQQVFIPKPVIPQSANNPANQQCAYVIMPNSPVKTYQFPPVVGVSETIQRSEDPEQQIVEKQEKNKDETIKKPSKGLSEHKIDGRKNAHEAKLNTTKMNFRFGVGRCYPGTRACADGSACIEKDDWCDGRVDCEDSSDELLCTCRERILPTEFCDGYFDCPRGEDELGCSGCQEDMFSCFDVNDVETTGTCLPMEKRCDFVKDCRNGNDEKDCNLISDKPAERDQVSVVSYSDGFLFRNWKGKWYPVCSANTWHLEACSAEIGQLTGNVEVKLLDQPNYKGLMAMETEQGVEMVEECGQERGGAVLQVVCPEPVCGARPAARGDRVRRELPTDQQARLEGVHPVTSSPEVKEEWLKEYFDSISLLDRKKFYKEIWDDRVKREIPTDQQAMSQRSGTVHPVTPSPEVKEERLKEFFDSISSLDRKRFYKQLWGPLVQPYMGLNHNLPQDPPNHRPPLGPDPSVNSWQTYLKPYQRTYESFDPGNFFPSYQDIIQYGQMQPYDFIPIEYYGSYPSEYINNYIEPLYYSEDYVRHLREIAEEEAVRGEMMRVVGGTRSEPGAWPWIVSIYRDGYFLCGGTILTPSHILTAAHCVDRNEDKYYEVRAGLLRRKSFSPQEQIRTVDQIISHKNYNRKTMENDIALMRLSERLKYNRWVLPACLPPERPDLPVPGTFCTAIGWGALHERGPDPDHLHEVEIPILPSCNHFADRRGGEICAGYLEGGMDTCQGDSGGPLLCRSGSDKWYLAGVVSHGEGCARLGEPGAYTRVYLFRNWIQEHLSWPPESAKISSTSCPGLLCKSGLCLSEGSRCNSKFDCFDGEDEKDCESSDPLPGQRSALNDTTPTGEEVLTLHSQQTKNVDTSHLFSCKRFEQRVLSSRVCDKKVDCEDGSDESGCTCADRLKHLAPHLLCDGVTHCKDTSDESECPAKCHNDEFFCYKSGNCIPERSHCNLKKDCYFGEDEEDCYALLDDMSQLDDMKKPPFRLNGTVAVYRGSWQPYCLNSTPQAAALHICQQLGFRIASSHKVLNADMSGETMTCNHLYVSCSSSKDPVWMAPLFNSGSPQTLSVLITQNWLLAPTAGLEFKDSKATLTAWLGKRNLSLAVEGPEDEYLQVDGLNTLSDGYLTLLHLQQPASITKQVMPLLFPSWPTPINENEKCEVLWLTKEGIVSSLALKPVTCMKGFRCYKVNLTSDPAVCSITGIVMCHSDYGPYLASVMSGAMCKTPLLHLRDLTLERKDIMDNIESGLMEELEESDCEGVRCEWGGCLAWERVGDGIEDCYDARDESSQALAEKEQQCTLYDEQCTCPPGEFLCPGGKCLSSAKFCDGHQDCNNGEDESSCDCRSYLALTRPEQLCDGIQNCLDKEDESWDFCFNRSDCSNSFQCPGSGGCIPTSFVCDGDADCPNSEDEEMCIAMRSPIDKPKEGVLFSRLYGELVAQCLEPESGDELAEKVCSLRADPGLASAHYSLVPYQYVLVDTFTSLRLNSNFSLTLRPDREFASVQTSTNQTCSVLYIQCK